MIITKRYEELITQVEELKSRLRKANNIIDTIRSVQADAFIVKKDEFISTASHELKTPVTSIKGYVQLLQYTFKKEGNTKAAGLLKRVDMQVNKLANLISDLLDVKKIKNGQLQYHTGCFDLNELVKEIAEEMENVLKEHVIVTTLGPVKNIYGDRNKIGQVIKNFLENAGKYSVPGSLIDIKSVKKQNSILLTVQDYGIGIPEKQQSKVFEKYYKVDDDKENTYSGLGLGLYICSEIIKHHNGTIGVKSVKGKGAEFYFKLPAG
ncbi:sensor histidine kinase [Ferruginibacter sp.]